MKHFGSILEFTHQRNNDLLRVFRRHIAEADYVVMPNIFKIVADSPSIRFWVSEERAAIVISMMLAGKPLPPMRPNKCEMFQEIFKRYLEMRHQHPDKSVFALVSVIVNQPAPKFYLTPRTVGEIIYRIRNGWYDNRYISNNK